MLPAYSLQLAPTLHAHQLSPDEALSSCFGGDPWPDLPRRIVADVLGVTAVEVGDPVLFLVLMKTNDPPCDCRSRFGFWLHLVIHAGVLWGTYFDYAHRALLGIGEAMSDEGIESFTARIL
jgi:hypothetical protein